MVKAAVAEAEAGAAEKGFNSVHWAGNAIKFFYVDQIFANLLILY